MRKFLYIKYNKIFETKTPKEAAIKCAKFTSFTKSINIKIKDIKKMKIYNYIAYKIDNKIIIKSKQKKLGGINFNHLDRVVLYDTVNNGYITQYDKNEIENPYYYYNKEKTSKMYKISNRITKNSIFTLYKYNDKYSFSLEYPNDEHHYLSLSGNTLKDSNNNIYEGFRFFLSKNSTQFSLNNNKIKTFSNELPVIEVRLITNIPTLKYLRNRETGVKK